MMISPTMLSTFNECPYKFKVIYVEERRPLFKPEFEFGKRVHRIIAEYYKILPHDATPRDVPMILGNAIKKVVGYVDENLVRYFKGFEDFEKRRLSWHVNPKPLLVEAEVKKGRLHGIIDAAFKRNEHTIVIDWKTGMVREPAMDEHLKIQGNFYMHLMGASEMYFVFLRYGSWHKLTYDEAFLAEKLRALLEAIDGNSYPRKRGRQCERCEVNLHCYFDEHELKWWEL